MAKEYRVSGYDEEEVAPEETLADSFSSFSKAEFPIGVSALQIFLGLAMAVLIFYTLTAFRLEVINGQEWRARAVGNHSSVFDILAIRGNIVDQSGKVLVENQPVFDLMAISADLPKEEAMSDWLKELAVILGQETSALQEIFAQNRHQAIFFLQRDLQKDQVLKIQNKYAYGVHVINSVKRNYLQGEKYAAIIGYTGQVTPEDLQDDYYSINDRKGRTGVEFGFENYLRGEHGQIFFDQTSKRYLTTASHPGQTVVLNIKGDVQEHLYAAVNEVLRMYGLKFGSAVAQNPQTGEVLGMVSFPSYDNNDLSGEINEEQYKKYFVSKDRPLFNRAIGGRFNPGSTIKVVLALAGLKEGVVTPRTTFTDSTGYVTIQNIYNPEIVYTYRDWRIQGTVDLKKALAWSSDLYFYAVGGGPPAGGNKIKGLGFERLEKYFRAFLIDQSLKIDIPGESAGFVPSEQWKIAKFGQPWFMGDTYNVSIGQGDLLVTPLWLSSYISAIANGGTIYRPWLVDKIVDGERKDVRVFDVEKLATLPFDRATLDIVREGLREVVLSGTGQILKSVPVPVAAKTGTAEVFAGGKNLNSLLVAFAPYDNPEIAISVVIEGVGSHQGLALQTAKNFLQWYFTPALSLSTPTP